jgi:hypothetical protein
MNVERSGKMENTIALQGPIQCLWNFQLSTFNANANAGRARRAPVEEEIAR